MRSLINLDILAHPAVWPEDCTDLRDILLDVQEEAAAPDRLNPSISVHRRPGQCYQMDLHPAAAVRAEKLRAGTRLKSPSERQDTCQRGLGRDEAVFRLARADAMCPLRR